MSIPTQGTIPTASPTGRFKDFPGHQLWLLQRRVRRRSANFLRALLAKRAVAEESLGYLRYLEKKNMQQEMI